MPPPNSVIRGSKPPKEQSTMSQIHFMEAWALALAFCRYGPQWQSNLQRVIVLCSWPQKDSHDGHSVVLSIRTADRIYAWHSALVVLSNSPPQRSSCECHIQTA